MRDERISLLTRLGLTEVQARTYAALAALGEAPHREIAEHAGIPRTRAYPVLRALVDLGLATEQDGTVAARPLDAYLDARRARVEAERTDLIARRDRLRATELPLGAEPDTRDVRLVRGAARSAQAVADALRTATGRVDAALTAATLHALHADPATREALERVPHVRLAVYAAREDAGRLLALPARLLQHMALLPRDAWHVDRILVDDERLVMRLHPGPAQGVADDRTILALITRDAAVAADAAATLHALWDQGKPLADDETPPRTRHPGGGDAA